MIDSFGERMGEFSLHDFNPETLEFDQVISSKISDTASDVILEYNEEKRPIFWNKLVSGDFPDSPKCGFNNAKCPIEGN